MSHSRHADDMDNLGLLSLLIGSLVSDFLAQVELGRYAFVVLPEVGRLLMDLMWERRHKRRTCWCVAALASYTCSDLAGVDLP